MNDQSCIIGTYTFAVTVFEERKYAPKYASYDEIDIGEMNDLLFDFFLIYDYLFIFISRATLHFVGFGNSFSRCIFLHFYPKVLGNYCQLSSETNNNIFYRHQIN